MTTIDWLVVLAYFLASPAHRLGHEAQQGHGRRLLPGQPRPRLVHRRRVDLRVEHRLGAPGRPGRIRAPRAAWRWRTTSCTRGACSCWAGCSCPSTCARSVYTMPEFLERRFSPTARIVLSVTSLLTHVLTKFAVSIFAGGVVFRTLLPEMFTSGCSAPTGTRSGSARSRSSLLTGVYTVLGGMRAVAYTEAVQTVRPGARLRAADGLRPDQDRRVAASCARPSIRTCSTSGSRSSRPASRAPGRR